MTFELLSNKRLVRDLLFGVYYKDLCKRMEVLVCNMLTGDLLLTTPRTTVKSQQTYKHSGH